jgi:hypothetical protein
LRIDYSERHGYWRTGTKLEPIVPVTLIGKSGKSFSTYALIDSGADVCIFHSNFAKHIGLDYLSGRPDKMSGIDQEYIDVYYHRIYLKVGESCKVRCDVAFSDGIGTEPGDQLIGRDVVFNKLKIGFRQKIEAIYTGPEII